MLRILLLVNTVLLGSCYVSQCRAQDDRPRKRLLRIATFQTDVTPPVGSPLSYGFVRPAERIVDPLSARGVILLTEEKPIVLCVIDWVAISNGAHDAWREALADAAGTTTDRVSVHVAHQHDTPGVDFTAAEILATYGHRGIMFDDASAREAIRRTAAAAGVAVKQPRRVSHIGYGQAKVEKFASNRRVIGPDGKIRYWRGSTTTNADARAEPEGTIDPYLRVISFWDADAPLVSMTYYASHPQSYYGRGGVSADTVGLARSSREEALPQVAHLHFNGAGGNIAAGKYNDGATANRAILAERKAAHCIAVLSRQAEPHALCWMRRERNMPFDPSMTGRNAATASCGISSLLPDCCPERNARSCWTCALRRSSNWKSTCGRRSRTRRKRTTACLPACSFQMTSKNQFRPCSVCIRRRRCRVKKESLRLA